MPEAIIVELIRFATVVFSIIIPLLIAMFFYAWRKGQSNYRCKLKTALHDIRFLSAVIDEYANLSLEVSGKSNRQFVRQLAHNRASWSGKFTPSLITKELERIEHDTKKDSQIMSLLRLDVGASKDA